MLYNAGCTSVRSSGAIGTSHGDDYYIQNPDSACIKSAQWQTAILFMLLCNNAEGARKIISEYKPLFATRQDYCRYLDGIFSFGDRITYDGDNATVKL